jgi:hypothetical protein
MVQSHRHRRNGIRFHRVRLAYYVPARQETLQLDQGLSNYFLHLRCCWDHQIVLGFDAKQGMRTGTEAEAQAIRRGF